jgi:hypothetical protein
MRARLARGRKRRGARLRPGGASVGRLEDAAAVIAVGREVFFPGSGVDDEVVAGIDRDRAHGQRALRVGQRRPTGAAIGGLPDPTGRRADIDDAGVGRIDRDGVGASGSGRGGRYLARSDRRPQVHDVPCQWRPLRRRRPHGSELLHMVRERTLVGARRNLLERKCALLVKVLEAPQRGTLCLRRQRPQLRNEISWRLAGGRAKRRCDDRQQEERQGPQPGPPAARQIRSRRHLMSYRHRFAPVGGQGPRVSLNIKELLVPDDVVTVTG